MYPNQHQCMVNPIALPQSSRALSLPQTSPSCPGLQRRYWHHLDLLQGVIVCLQSIAIVCLQSTV